MGACLGGTNGKARPRDVESRRRSTHHRRLWDVLTTTLPATFFFAGSLFKAPRGPLNARREDSASDARHVTGVAEVTDVPGIETSGRRAPCNAVNRGGHGGVGKVLERIESHCEKSLATTDTRKSRPRYDVFGFCRHARPERRARVTSGGALLSARRCASSRGSESFPRVWPRDGLRGGPGSRCSPERRPAGPHVDSPRRVRRRGDVRDRVERHRVPRLRRGGHGSARGHDERAGFAREEVQIQAHPRQGAVHGEQRVGRDVRGGALFRGRAGACSRRRVVPVRGRGPFRAVFR